MATRSMRRDSCFHSSWQCYWNRYAVVLADSLRPGCCRLGILKAWALRCRRRQSPEHQAYRANANHALARIGADLVIPAVAPIAAYPGKGALDDPANLQRLKTHGVGRAAADLQPQPPPAIVIKPLIETVIVVFVVAEERR